MSDAGTALRERDVQVARKVNGERVTLLGWGTAILMQFSHPLVAAGVAEHSTVFSGTRAWIRRFHATIASMLDLTFGEEPEAARAIATINAIHRRVRGTVQDDSTALPAGTPYSAQDPVLLCWVHVTLEYALSRAYELFVGPLTQAEKDQGCAEAVATMVQLGVPAQMVPATLAGVYGCLAEMIASGNLVISTQARVLARDLLAPPVPAIIRPLLIPVRLVAI
ncbi:MAG TPA: oxygenase MpaB family protein, partial [Chloroflexota bacterium]|nr:oxygenase MpaB family protein [Chloroflexota bacterium]